MARDRENIQKIFTNLYKLPIIQSQKFHAKATNSLRKYLSKYIYNKIILIKVTIV